MRKIRRNKRSKRNKGIKDNKKAKRLNRLNRFNKLSAALRMLSSLNRSSFLILIALFITSCDPAPWTNGKAITETRWFDDTITSLYVYDDINVTLIEADTFRIEITTGENLMEKITSNISDNGLYLRNENIRLWARSYDYPLDIKVYHNSLTHINYMSWGDLKSEGPISKDNIDKFNMIVEHGSGHIDLKLNCDTLILKSYDGTALISVAGSANYTDIYHNARNDIHTENLVCKDAAAIIDYEGSIYVNCTNKLTAEIRDFGNIYYKGEPQIESSSHPQAKGKLLPME